MKWAVYFSACAIIGTVDDINFREDTTEDRFFNLLKWAVYFSACAIIGTVDDINFREDTTEDRLIPSKETLKQRDMGSEPLTNKEILTALEKAKNSQEATDFVKNTIVAQAEGIGNVVQNATKFAAYEMVALLGEEELRRKIQARIKEMNEKSAEKLARLQAESEADELFNGDPENNIVLDAYDYEGGIDRQSYIDHVSSDTIDAQSKTGGQKIKTT